MRTAAGLTDTLEQVLRPEGITTAQYNVLRILRGAEPGGLCRNEVRDRMLTRMPDMSRLLDRMEGAGLVVRARREDDRRIVSTRITRQGLQALDRLESLVVDAHVKQFAHMSPPDVRALVAMLDRVREGAS